MFTNFGKLIQGKESPAMILTESTFSTTVIDFTEFQIYGWKKVLSSNASDFSSEGTRFECPTVYRLSRISL